jgi:uncharacterized protein (DUF342 family)
MIGTLKISISEDQTRAYLTLVRPPGAPADARNDFAELVAELSGNQLLTHLDEDALAQIIDDFNERQRGCDNVLIADTKQPVKPGKNGWLEWIVQQDSAISEDARGKVDFWAHSTLKNVQVDELLAVLHPPVHGKPGLSVKGEPIAAPPVKEAVYIAGQNVEFRPDTGEFFAMVAGRIDLRGHVINVSRVFEVEGDVDFSVGNLDFEGFIRVTGNVQDNFRVRAKEGVQIDKVVEAANVDSGGSVTVLGGVNCRNKGVVRCEGDLITRFLNNAEVYAKGEMKIEKEILNCQINAARVNAPGCLVSGGEIITSGNMEIRDAGSEMGVRTILHAGRDAYVEREVIEMERILEQDKALVSGLNQRIDAAESADKNLEDRHRQALEALRGRLAKLQSDIDAQEAKIEARKKDIFNLDASITIHRRVNPGVIIRIGKYERPINQQFDGFRRFIFDRSKFEIVAAFQ